MSQQTSCGVKSRKMELWESLESIRKFFVDLMFWSFFLYFSNKARCKKSWTRFIGNMALCGQQVGEICKSSLEGPSIISNFSSSPLEDLPRPPFGNLLLYLVFTFSLLTLENCIWLNLTSNRFDQDPFQIIDRGVDWCCSCSWSNPFHCIDLFLGMRIVP
jgi:hypothetical protein